MNAQPDFYKTLGVAPDSDDVVIAAAYKALMRKYHPDTNSDQSANARAQDINAAYAVLGDPGKRARYDRSRSEKDTDTAPPPPPPPPHSSDWPQSSTPEIQPAKRNNGLAGIIVLAVGAIVAVGLSSRPTSRTTSAPSPAYQSLGPAFQATTPVNGGVLGMRPVDLPTVAPSAPASLPSTATPVDFDDLEAAAHQFDKVLGSKGIVGARAFSEACHKALAANASWSAADRCVAFDLSAAHIDQGVASASNGRISQDNYFRFKDDNPSDTYTSLGAFKFSVIDRVATIRRAVEPVVERIVLDRIRRSDSATQEQPRVAGARAERGPASIRTEVDDPNYIPPAGQ